MKKFFALVLCLMMAFCAVSAVAEEPEIEPIEMLFDGTWIQFEDGFEFYQPAEWMQYELTEEHYAQGMFYAAGSTDGMYACVVGWRAMEQEMTIEELQMAMSAQYPDAAAVEVNGVGLVAYIDVERNLLNCLALDATEPGFYLFAFSPADDADFQNLASLIASSIRNITVE